MPDSQFSAQRRKYHRLFEQNVLSAHIRKKYKLLKLFFGKYLEPRKELTSLRGQDHCKNLHAAVL